MGELPDSIDGIVVVEGQQIAVPGLERICLANELDGGGSVGREDRHIFVGDALKYSRI